MNGLQPFITCCHIFKQKSKIISSISQNTALRLGKMGTRWPQSFKDVSHATIESLPAEHRDIFVHALKNVLSTELAEVTYAQILDGAPIADVAIDRYSSHLIDPDHPVRSHKTLCAGVLEKARRFRSVLDTTAIPFQSQVNLALHYTVLNKP
jgi:hypothetical protein